MCPLRSLAVEDLLHVLRDCPYATQLWRQLVPLQYRRTFFAARWKQWFRYNCASNKKQVDAGCWSQIFAIGCWMLWNWRNWKCHDLDFQPHPRPRFEVLRFVQNFNNSTTYNELLHSQQPSFYVSRNPSKHGW